MSTPLWNKKIKCPFCTHEFETTRIRSSVIKIKDKQTDFGNIYEGECPYLYAVTVCPQCTFAALNKDFDTIRAGAEPMIMEVSRQIRQSAKRKPDIFALGNTTPEVAIKRHELAITFMKIRKYGDLGILAGLYLHLVWIYRLIQDYENEKRVMALTAKAYEDFFDKGNRLPENLGEPGVLYLIGELNRRQGLYKEARRYYEKALASKEIRAFPRIAEMTRDMMLAAKNQMELAGM